MYIALIWSEESLPWYVMKLSEMLTKTVLIFSDMLTYDCHGCLILRDSLPYMSMITMAASLSEESLPWYVMKLSEMLTKIVVIFSKMFTYGCLIIRDSLPYMSWKLKLVRCSPSFSWNSVRCLPMLISHETHGEMLIIIVMISVRCSSSLSWYQWDAFLWWYVMVFSEMLTNDCREPQIRSKLTHDCHDCHGTERSAYPWLPWTPCWISNWPLDLSHLQLPPESCGKSTRKNIYMYKYKR